MLADLTSAAILAEATTWAASFDGVLTVVVGLGVGFAVVRFVKSMFF